MKKLKLTQGITYLCVSKVRFMSSRFEEMRMSLERAQSNIDLALDEIAQRTDITLMHYNEHLNKIMLALTVITIFAIPPTLIGGLMGMNVKVPF